MKWTRVGATTAFVVALAIGLALSLGLWANWTAGAAGTEYIVNQDTGTGDAAPCNDPDFPSVSDIETVIDDASVQNGDTLVLCPGIYVAGAGGTVEVDKKLTIQGQETVGRDQIVIQVSVAGADGLAINTTGVTIRHLKVGGPGVASDKGISVHAGDATIEDVDITGWSAGIDVFWTNDVTIRDSQIHGNEPDGISLDHANNVRIARNTIVNDIAREIYIDTADQIVVEDNTMSRNIPTGSLLVVKGRSNVNVLRNTFTTHVSGTESNEGIYLELPAEALVIIGGSDADANTFDGNLEANPPVGFGYYIYLTCDSQATVDATHNYWKGNPVISRGVSGVIFNDEDDDPANPGADCPGNDDGAVVFHPTASGPAPTPTPSPTPTATATPTATVTATPTATPGATRTVNLSPQGWHTLTWSGADATDPAAVLGLSCLSGRYAIAYEWVGSSQQWLRYIPGNSLLSNITAVNKYDSLLIAITAAGVSCDMPVAQ